MPRGFGKKKNPFDMLSDDEQAVMASLSPEEIRDRIAKSALDQAALEDAQKNDGDLSEKKEVVKFAMEPYRDGKKRLKQLVAFGRMLLDAKGKESGTSPTQE